MSAISDSVVLTVCANCNVQKVNSPMLRCGACKSAIYCGKECQKADWPRHKPVCKKGMPLSSSESKVGRVTQIIVRPSMNTVGAKSPEPTTSGYLRWMNIWMDAAKRGLICRGPKRVLVVGPGMKKFGAQTDCPLMAEAIWLAGRGSRFTVLDSNEEVLAAVNSVHLAESKKMIMATFTANERTANLQELKKYFSSAETPQYEIVTRLFRMGKDSLPEELEPVDWAHMTLSLFYPMKDLAIQNAPREERIRLLGQFLSKIASKGVLYVDEDLVIALLATSEEAKRDIGLRSLLTPQNLNSLQDSIREFLGLKVTFNRLPQVNGLLIPPGQLYPIVLQPELPGGKLSATQTKDAFAIVVE